MINELGTARQRTAEETSKLRNTNPTTKNNPFLGSATSGVRRSQIEDKKKNKQQTTTSCWKWW
ncbi:hypothetical protein [Bradyrhizobium icense]|uniref:hypothetical protein n=1 Tax=Bradyrhizobium icense TaxID=1274631 RepID=UPI0018D39DA4|nr:hypothetical protein [Bradyrhizobium icense]